MSEELKLGQIITTPQNRDAIHIAVAPVTAGERLKPGQHIGFTGTGTVGESATPIGVVDPFLKAAVTEGQRFWMYLYPYTITALRHEWTHPAFTNDGIGVASESEKWLRNFASQVDADYEEMMEVAESHCGPSKWGGDYLSEGGKWEGQSTPDEFWEHFKNVTGKAPQDKTYGNPGIFSCSC